jgi:aryl-alcohol dehydrogenase-like predicted oxidoreductase
VEYKQAGLYDKGLGLTTWSPLASGLLTGKYAGGVIPDGSRLSLADYKNLAERKLGPAAAKQVMQAQLIIR